MNTLFTGGFMFELTNKPMLLTLTNLKKAVKIDIPIAVNILMNDYTLSRIRVVFVEEDYTIIHITCSQAYFNLVCKGLL